MNHVNEISINPIVGEITANGVIFLIVTKVSILLDLYIDGTYYATYLTNTKIPTRIFVDVAPNTYTLDKPVTLYTWKLHRDIVNYNWHNLTENIVSEHKLKSSYDRLIFLSCDMPAADTQHSLWNTIGSIEHEGICFHLGDNIYGDAAYNTQNITYDDIYVKTWSRWAHIMNNFSHIMIADDHEICDGYDYNVPLNSKINSGLLAYHQYQSSLQQNQNISGFFIKTVDKDTTVYGLSRTVIGITPLEMIKSLKYSFSGNIILAISSAPIPLALKFQTLYGMIFGSFGWESNELLELYDICFSLLRSGQVRSIILIGGDLHFGISGIISDGKYQVHVYVASAISAHPTHIEHLLANEMNGTFPFGNYVIELQSKAYRNYLSISLPINNSNPGLLIYSTESQPANMIAYLEEMTYIIKPRINFPLIGSAIQNIMSTL